VPRLPCATKHASAGVPPSLRSIYIRCKNSVQEALYSQMMATYFKASCTGCLDLQAQHLLLGKGNEATPCRCVPNSRFDCWECRRRSSSMTPKPQPADTVRLGRLRSRPPDQTHNL
jgi:hypothetical protein